MANVIQIKRSASTSAPNSLEKGELAWVDHGTGGAAGILYVGDMTGGGAAIRKIGGPGWMLEELTNTALTGSPTAPNAVAYTNANHVGTADLATTEFVMDAVAGSVQPIADAGDTNISGPVGGHVLIWDGTDSWDNKPLSGDVSIDAAGATIVGGVAANSVVLGNDTQGNYVGTIIGTVNEIEVLNGAGSEGAAVQIGLPDNVTVTGNLTVNGTTTTVDSSVVTILDPIFSVGQNATDDNKDRGIEFKYNDGAAKIGFFGYDEDANEFTGWTAASATSETYNGTRIDANFGDIAGTLTTASQTNITGVGTIGTGVWQGTAVGTQYGGTGQDFSARTGIISISGGTMDTQTEVPVTLGGTGVQALAAGALLLGADTADMTPLTVGAAGQHLTMVGGVPAWSDAVDGGTF